MRPLILVAPILIMLSSCSSVGIKPQTGAVGGGSANGKFYQNDGPGSLSGIDLNSIPDAVPRDEKIISASTRPYTALGRTFTPMTTRRPYQERGEISWYGKQYHGRKTSIGEVYDMYAMTAAHPTLPLPSFVRVTNLENGQSVVVRVNDRGPFLQGRILDLSFVAAAKLGYVNRGATMAEVTAVFPDDRPPPPPVAVVIPQSQKPTQNAPRLRTQVPAPDLPMINTASDVVLTPIAPTETLSANAPLTPVNVQKIPPPNQEGWLPRLALIAGEYVQVGAFSNADSASSAVRTIEGALQSWPGSPLAVVRLHDNDGRYKVWLGESAQPNAQPLTGANRLAVQEFLRAQGINTFKTQAP